MDAEPTPEIDLDAYLGRIGFAGDPRPDRATLEALHLAHAISIPFENLDISLGRPIRLDSESLQAKLVRDRRGGYCFEQNLLFAAVLERIGFPVTRLAARVRFGTQRILPRTHMLLKVEVDGGPWLADVGFGGWGLLAPIPLDAARESRQYAWTYGLVEESAGLWALRALREGRWEDLYAFTTEPHYQIDYEMGSHYVSTHPDSRFVRTLIVQRPTPEARYTLRDRELIVSRGDSSSLRAIGDDDELLAVLTDTFGLEFPPGTRFRSPVA